MRDAESEGESRSHDYRGPHMRDVESEEESRMTYTAYCFHSKCWQVILGSIPLSISSCKTQRQIALIFYIPLSYLCYFIFCSVIDIYIGRDISLGLHIELWISCCGNRTGPAQGLGKLGLGLRPYQKKKFL